MIATLSIHIISLYYVWFYALSVFLGIFCNFTYQMRQVISASFRATVAGRSQIKFKYQINLTSCIILLISYWFVPQHVDHLIRNLHLITMRSTYNGYWVLYIWIEAIRPEALNFGVYDSFDVEWWLQNKNNCVIIMSFHSFGNVNCTCWEMKDNKVGSWQAMTGVCVYIKIRFC